MLHVAGVWAGVYDGIVTRHGRWEGLVGWGRIQVGKGGVGERRQRLRYTTLRKHGKFLYVPRDHPSCAAENIANFQYSS